MKKKNAKKSRDTASLNQAKKRRKKTITVADIYFYERKRGKLTFQNDITDGKLIISK